MIYSHEDSDRLGGCTECILLGEGIGDLIEGAKVVGLFVGYRSNSIGILVGHLQVYIHHSILRYFALFVYYKFFQLYCVDYNVECCSLGISYSLRLVRMS